MFINSCPQFLNKHSVIFLDVKADIRCRCQKEGAPFGVLIAAEVKEEKEGRQGGGKKKSEKRESPFHFCHKMQPLNGCALILLSIGLLNVQAESPPPEDAFESSNVVSNDDGTTNSEASKIQIREVPVSKPLGEVSAIAINSDGSLLAFHRGDRIWDKE